MPIPKRLRLKGWLEGESLRKQVRESKSIDEIIENLYSYLTLICGEENDWDELIWEEVAKIYYMGNELNLPKIAFPMLRSPVLNREEEDLPWEYSERSWYYWANRVSSVYGWELEYVAELDIDDAIGLLQEILIDEQLDKEWQWNLSEITYSYDSQTKQSKHKDYPRPYWMIPEAKPPKAIKIRKDMLPVGLIIADEADYDRWKNSIKH